MKPGLLFAIVGTALGLTAMVYAFLANASPYVTVAQARQIAGDNLHLAGDIVSGTLRPNPHEGVVRFTLRDEKGGLIPVVYTGIPPANMGSATQVVAVGGHREGRFEAHRLLVKCPSKYESKPSLALPTGPIRVVPAETTPAGYESAVGGTG